MAVILVRGVGVPSEDTEGPSELASVPAGPQLSLRVGAHRVQPEPSSHPCPCSESQGAKVSVQWDGSDCQRGEGLGAASRDGDKDLRGSQGRGVLPSLGHASFLLQMGCLAVQVAEWGLDPAFRYSMLSLHSLGRRAAKPHASSSPFPESSGRHSGNLMQERTRRGIGGGGGGGDGSVLCTGDREREER